MHALQGPYQVEGGRPMNIRGRTGLAGRGVLGKYVHCTHCARHYLSCYTRFISDSLSRWGPNHAADPIVTRWKREEDGQVVSDAETGKQVYKFR